MPAVSIVCKLLLSFGFAAGVAVLGQGFAITPAGNAPPPSLEQAGHGIATLQGWYTESTGLYKTTGWWNSANALTVVADYARLAGSSEYAPIFANTFQAAQVAPQGGESTSQAGQTSYKGFLNNYYDDEGWWSLAWIDAYDLTHKPEYLAMAASIFQNMSGGWDQTCGGGIWWSKDRKYKNAIANELFLSAAAHLATRAATGRERKQYAQWAQEDWKWFQKSGMINAQNLVNDGLDATCKNNGRTTWTYNQGVVLGGLAELQKVKRDKNQLREAQAIADAAMTHLTDAKDILHDSCEPTCGADGVQFKGVFMRNLVELNQAAPNPRYATFAATNAANIWNTDQRPDFKFGEVWSGPVGKVTAATQSSALDAILAAAAIGAKTNSR